MAMRNPARVLPDPVGAAISVSWPEAMAGHPWAWASVGPPGNRCSNHAATAGWNSKPMSANTLGSAWIGEATASDYRRAVTSSAGGIDLGWADVGAGL